MHMFQFRRARAPLFVAVAVLAVTSTGIAAASVSSPQGSGGAVADSGYTQPSIPKIGSPLTPSQISALPGEANNTPAPAPVAVTLPPLSRVSGISNNIQQGPFSDSQFQVVNFYAGQIGTNWVSVWAGTALRGFGNPLGGALFIQIGPVDPGSAVATQTIGTVLVPGSNEFVRIVSVAGEIMTLQADGGTVVGFNLSTDAFSAATSG